MYRKKIDIRVLSVLLMLSFKTVAFPQTNTDMWSALSRVTVKTAFNPDLLTESSSISVSPAIEKLHNTKIEVEGYMIPLTGQTMQSHFMLSKYPQSTCFFCGKAGPETAMQVFMEDNRKVKISERKLKVKGTLLVNPGDANSLLYSLENATILEP